MRRAVDDDVDAIVALLRLGLGEGTLERSSEVWRWKHQANPFGASPVLLAHDETGLIAVRAFLKWRLVDDDGSMSAVRAVDTVTHPERQGRGLFKRLTLQLCEELADDGVDVVFNTPNDKSGPGYLKMGWRDLGKVSLWARPIGPALPHRRRQIASASLLKTAELPVAHAIARLHTPITRDVLAWRYADVPGLDYRVVVEPGVAVAIGRRRRRGGRMEAMVCEVLHRGDARGIAVAASCVRDLVRGLDADYAVAKANLRSRTAVVLAAAGFLFVPRFGPRFVVRPLRGSTRALERRSWDLRLGDIELF